MITLDFIKKGLNTNASEEHIVVQLHNCLMKDIHSEFEAKMKEIIQLIMNHKDFELFKSVFLSDNNSVNDMINNIGTLASKMSL